MTDEEREEYAALSQEAMFLRHQLSLVCNSKESQLLARIERLREALSEISQLSMSRFMEDRDLGSYAMKTARAALAADEDVLGKTVKRE